jgi:organic radical activating enzyme
MSERQYHVNEVFYSIQGEGVRAGTANVFVRFAYCNLECRVEPGPKSPGGFDCDTEFASGRAVTLGELDEWIATELGTDIQTSDDTGWIILTGGEPGLQVDTELIDHLHDAGWKLAIETNGSVVIPEGLDWVTVSPKVAEHAIRQKTADEVKYVRGHGQAVPESVVVADHYLLSPAHDGWLLDDRVLQWCIKLVKENPPWRLSIQQHKTTKVR